MLHPPFLVFYSAVFRHLSVISVVCVQIITLCVYGKGAYNCINVTKFSIYIETKVLNYTQRRSLFLSTLC